MDRIGASRLENFLAARERVWGDKYFNALALSDSLILSRATVEVEEFADSKLKLFLLTHNGKVTTNEGENI